MALTLPRATLMAFREGDAAAFAELVRACDPLVRAAVSRFWRGAFEREEAMQEIWVHAFRQRASLDPARLESFTGWLAVLARRRCLDLLRQPAPDAPANADEAEALTWLESAPEPDRAETHELTNAVETFKARLEPDWRRFFELHFVEGLDYAEVSARLKIGKLRCKYMKKVLAARARRDIALRAALGRLSRLGAGDAS